MRQDINNRFVKGYQTPSSVISDARVHQLSPLGKNLNLKNFSAFELNKFIGERMKEGAMANKSLIPRTLQSIENEEVSPLKRRMMQQHVNGRKALISN